MNAEPNPLSDADYRQELTLLSTEIVNAEIIYHTHEELNRLALEDEATRDLLNVDALFWLATSTPFKRRCSSLLAESSTPTTRITPSTDSSTRRLGISLSSQGKL